MYNPAIETMPLDQLRDLQNKRLVDLVNRLYQSVPFYKERFDREGIQPTDIRGLADLHRLPFTCKDDLRNNYPFGLFARPMDEVRRIHASSGTTGKPTVVGYTAGDLGVFDEVIARSLVAAGARPGMKLHNAYGYGLFTGGLGMHGGATRLGMAVIPVSGGMTERQMTILQDFEPEVICCTPSYALRLSEECAHLGLDPKKLAVKYAILGAEPWTEATRTQVEKGLAVKATNIYGLSEVMGPGVSQEDVEEKGTGSYIWEDHFFPEVVDPTTGAPLPHGEEGVLVFTTLTKQAFPILRYWTNDLCSIYYDPEGKRNHIKMSSIKGRSDDMLIIRGVNLFPTQVEALLHKREDLSPNFRLRIDRAGNMDKVTVEVEVKPGTNVENDELALRFAHAIKENIGLTMQVDLKQPGAVPRSQGGKLSRVLDNR